MMESNAKMTFPEPVTYLSPRVHSILCESAHCATDSSRLFFRGLIISWEDIRQEIHEADLYAQMDTFEYFEHLSSVIGPCFHEAETTLREQSPCEFKEACSHLLKWTGLEDALMDCLKILQNDSDGTGTLQAILWSTSVLERSLGDVFLIRGSQCPSMLKDLLLTKELGDIFGPTVIQVLRLFLGPPTSLNIRNVAWHGFPIPGEIPKRFAYMLLAMAVGLGQILEDRGIVPESIPHRPFVAFPQIACMARVLPDSSWTSVIDVITESGCVPRPMLPVWDLIIEHYSMKRYGLAVSLLLPQLEHIIRRIFATVNECSHRVLTAENTVLFTTFDEMLEPILPEGKENRLREVLGDNTMDLLFDVLAYPAGPRVRDRVSHGETDLKEFPIQLTDQVLLLCTAICLQFVDVGSDTHQGTLAKAVKEVLRTYESVFFPINVAKRMIRELTRSLEQWVHIPKPPSDNDPTLESVATPWTDIDPQPLGDRLVYKAASGVIYKYLPGDTRLARSVGPFSNMRDHTEPILLRRIPTLYRWKDPLTSSSAIHNSKAAISGSEAELVGYIIRIAAHAQDVSNQVCDVMATRYGQWQRKELRSRQRSTYMRMINSVPVLSSGLNLTVVILTSVLMSLDDESVNTQSERIRAIKQTRMLLQHCENLKTYTSAAKNKWDEAVQSTDAIIKRLAAQ